jgi:hypothetical protein
MRPARLFTLAMLGGLLGGVASSPAFAQAAPANDAVAAGARVAMAERKLPPDEQADSDALRALAKATPMLPMERVEIKVNAPFAIGPISAMAQDKQGNIWVIHRPEDRNIDPVVMLDAKGKYIRSFGKGLYAIPHGIRIDPDGNVWTIDAHNSTVFKFSPEGKKLVDISVGDIPDATRPFCGATDVTFAKNGHVYVSDGYCNARFIEYDAAGKKIRQWGSKGKGDGEFNLVHDISLSADNILYVADRESGRVQWFDMDGKYLGQKHFGGQLFSAAVAPDGMVYVGTHAKGIGYDKDSTIFKFDPKTGKVIGKLEAFAHQMTIGADGAVLPGAVTVKIGNDPNSTSILVFRKKAM